MRSQEELTTNWHFPDILALPVGGFVKNRSSYAWWAIASDHKIVAEWDTTLAVANASQFTHNAAAQLSILRAHGLRPPTFTAHQERIRRLYNARSISQALRLFYKDGFHITPNDRPRPDPWDAPADARAEPVRRFGFRAMNTQITRRPAAQRERTLCQHVMMDGARGRLPRDGSRIEAPLSFRQLHVLALSGNGFVDSIIAAALNTTVDSIDTTATAVLGKLGVRSRPEGIDRLFAAGVFFPVIPKP